MGTVGRFRAGDLGAHDVPGGSAGQLICRVTVRRTSGRPLDLLRALIRTALICAVIPPIVYNRDRQGLHDLAVDSIVLQR